MKEYKRSDEEEQQMGKETAARFSKGKIRHDLIPLNPIEELAKVYSYGTRKYDADNWLKGLKWRENVIGPMLRHMWKWIRGEKIDDESGCHHLAMVVWQCFCLMEYERCSIGSDDRNPYGLDLMDEEQRNRRITIWRTLANQNKMENYNGLEVDLLQEDIRKVCDGNCQDCPIKIKENNI